MSERLWNLKIEAEGKSLRDAVGTIDGYSFQAEALLQRRLTERMGLLVGIETHHQSQKSRGEENSLDEFSFGFSSLMHLMNQKWRSRWLIGYITSPLSQTLDGHWGLLEADVRTQLFLSETARAKLRYKFVQFIPARGDPEVELRQSRIEFSPAAFITPWALGLQNKLTHRFSQKTETSYLDMAPFIKFEKNGFESLFKVIYRPVIGGDGRVWARNWQNTPVYSLELEMTL
ncbi:MAG: hypothetical protein HC902_13115 [Calothrix sp. SM1_5_4]|nr:hypothetical protein [Calothrix sp. SM1_5_4]